MVSFPQVSPPKPCVQFSPIRATCPAHLIVFDSITRIIFGEEYRSLGSSFPFLHSPVTSSLLGPNILLSTLFSNILSLRSSLKVSDQVSHPHKTTGKIKALKLFLYVNIVLYFFFLIFLRTALQTFSLCSVGPHLSEKSCDAEPPMYPLALRSARKSLFSVRDFRLPSRYKWDRSAGMSHTVYW